MEYDYKRIGRNIRYIRNALGKDCFEFGKLLGWSESQVQKVESANTSNGTINERTLLEALKILSRIGLCSHTDILWGDLSYLRNGELSGSKAVADPVINVFDNEELAIVGSYVIESYAPIVVEPIYKDNVAFAQGMQLYTSRIKWPELSYTLSVLNEATNCFIAYYRETKDPVGALNALSLFVYQWVAAFSIPTKMPLDGKAYPSFAEKIKSFQLKESDAEEIRKAFFEKHGGCISELLQAVRESPENYDYAYYYLFVQSQFGMMNRELTHMDETHEKIFSITYFQWLLDVKNKYALALNELIREKPEE